MKNTMEAQTKELIGNLQKELSNWFLKTHYRDDQEKDPQLSKDYAILYSKCIAEEFKEFLWERSGTPNKMKELPVLCSLLGYLTPHQGYSFLKELLKVSFLEPSAL